MKPIYYALYFVIALFFVCTTFIYYMAAASWRLAYENLRITAERTDTENVCLWLLHDNYMPTPSMVEECRTVGVDITM